MTADDWSAAECRKHPRALWFPEGYDHAAKTAATVEAKRICHTCALRQVCLEDAMAHEGTSAAYERAGTYGGQTADERGRVADGRPQRAVQVCGDSGGYDRHKYRGEVPCDLCKATKRAMNHARYLAQEQVAS